MARFQHLPLYKATYSLCLNAHRLKLKMPKRLKHDAGEAFVSNCLKCVKIIIIANQIQEKYNETTFSQLFRTGRRAGPNSNIIAWKHSGFCIQTLNRVYILVNNLHRSILSNTKNGFYRFVYVLVFII